MAAVQYELTGATEKGTATVDGRKAAVAIFSKFLSSRLLPTYDLFLLDIKEGRRPIADLCAVQTFQMLATYLMTVFRTQKDSTPKLSTILQYISGAVSQVYQDFPDDLLMMQSVVVG